MAVFRVQRTKGYTVMSNFHLNDRTLSLKAKGMLSLMLSLPEDWDYTLRGLAAISLEGLDAIRAAVKELENRGYITRYQGRDSKGKLGRIEYTIYEQPQNKPCTENPYTGNPHTPDPTELITNKQNTKQENTKQSIIPDSGIEPDRIDEMDAYEAYREIIKDNLDYPSLCHDLQNDVGRINEVIELILEILCFEKKKITIGGTQYPAELVKTRFLKLTGEHIRYLFLCLENNPVKVHNIRAYMIKCLFNAPSTINNFYSAEVNHDMYGK